MSAAGFLSRRPQRLRDRSARTAQRLAKGPRSLRSRRRPRPALRRKCARPSRRSPAAAPHSEPGHTPRPPAPAAAADWPRGGGSRARVPPPHPRQFSNSPRPPAWNFAPAAGSAPRLPAPPAPPRDARRAVQAGAVSARDRGCLRLGWRGQRQDCVGLARWGDVGAGVGWCTCGGGPGSAAGAAGRDRWARPSRPRQSSSPAPLGAAPLPTAGCVRVVTRQVIVIAN